MNKIANFLFLFLSATPVAAEIALPFLQEIQKKKADLFIEQQRLLSEADILEKNLHDLAQLHEEKKENIALHQKAISTKLPLLARLGRSNPTRILVDPLNAQETLRGIILVRAFTSSLKHQIQQVQAELNETIALSLELKNKSQSHRQLLQGIELQQAQLSALEDDHIENYKKSELDRLSKEEDINTLLDESRTALSKTDRASALASKTKKLPFRWLELPVAGKIMTNSALQNKFSPHSQGILFQTRKNAEVSAPAKGKVVFKGPFRNQGIILMLDHGEKVYTVLMGMDKDKIDAQVGQKVYAGQKLGIMPGYGASKPVLYLELRQKGKAIDPKPYFAD